MNRVAIIWEGETVGFMEDPVPDMWYLEGKWRPGDSPKTVEFMRATQGLDARESFRSGSDMWVELLETGSEPLRATVMSSPGETIFVRRMFDAKPQRRWLRLWRKLTGG